MFSKASRFDYDPDLGLDKAAELAAKLERGETDPNWENFKAAMAKSGTPIPERQTEMDRFLDLIDKYHGENHPEFESLWAERANRRRLLPAPPKATSVPNPPAPAQQPNAPGRSSRLFPRLPRDAEERILNTFRAIRAEGRLQPIDQFPPIAKDAVYDPNLAGVLYCFNPVGDEMPTVLHGHHRLTLAQKCNDPTLHITIRSTDITDVAEGRLLNGLLNIAEGRYNSEPEWICRYMKEQGMTVSQLRDEGISIPADVEHCVDMLMRLIDDAFYSFLYRVIGLPKALELAALSTEEQSVRFEKYMDKQRCHVEVLEEEPVFLQFISNSPSRTTGDVYCYNNDLLRVTIVNGKLKCVRFVHQRNASQRKVSGCSRLESHHQAAQSRNWSQDQQAAPRVRMAASWGSRMANRL
jgi:hypothetical protein